MHRNHLPRVNLHYTFIDKFTPRGLIITANYMLNMFNPPVLVIAANAWKILLRIFLIIHLYFRSLLAIDPFLIRPIHKVTSNFLLTPTFFESQGLLFQDFVALKVLKKIITIIYYLAILLDNLLIFLQFLAQIYILLLVIILIFLS